MAKKRLNQTLAPSKSAERHPDAPRTIRENCEAPESRFRNASQVYRVCKQLVDDNAKRAARNTRLWKAYNRFPPTDYSQLVELRMEGQSNVNWGLLAFIIDNNKTSFTDMVRERTGACDIITKHGPDDKRKEYSEKISYAYDQYGLREWSDYMFYIEQDVQDMLLFGKAIEMMDDDTTYESQHVPITDILVPDDTELNLKNFDLMARVKKYTLNEIWGKIKDEGSAKARGWNRDAVIEAMRAQKNDWNNNKSSIDLAKELSAGKIALSSVMKERLPVFELFVKEYNGKISKHVVLQDYDPLLSSTRRGQTEQQEDDDNTIDDCGFLFTKTGFAESIHKVMAVFISNVGSGLWHVTPSLAESVFVQCRQYDVTMNSIMDAIKLNMTLMLKGQTADATNKLKDMIFGQFAIIPSDLDFAQHRIQIDTQVATNTLQYMMSDVYSGIGSYRVQEKDKKGEQPTATQRQLDAAESARLSGSEIGRYNDQHTIYHREQYVRFVTCTEGMDGYERYKKFKEYLQDNDVPAAAWKPDNIEKITSNMLAGAGSPSYKLMAANQIITFTNMTPKDDGQRSAIEDGVAAVAGRSNVHRYMPKKKRIDPDFEERYIGLECEAFQDPILNPKNVQVLPDDNHVKHVEYHLEDMASTVMAIEEHCNKGTITEQIGMLGMTRLQNEGGHVQAHMQFLARDAGKQPLVKEFTQNLGTIQAAIAKVGQLLQQAKAEKENSEKFDPATDPKVAREVAISNIQIDTQTHLNQLKLQGIAEGHQVRQQAIKDKAASDIAISRAKAEQEAAAAAKKAEADDASRQRE